VIPAQVEECLWVRWVRFCTFTCDANTSGGVLVDQVGAFFVFTCDVSVCTLVLAWW
jgi:hypothetical protein